MVSGIDPVVGPCNLPLFVDQKAHAIWPSRLWILAGTVCECDRAIAIAEQRKLEIIFLRECGVCLHAVEAGAEDLDVVFIIVVLMVAEPATLDRSPRGVRRGVKPQQYLPPAQIRQRYSAAVMRRQGKFGSPIARFEHLGALRSTVGCASQFNMARSRASICWLTRSFGSISKARSNSAAAAVIIPLAAYRRPRFK
jgi:hypothetical protein